MKKQSWTYCALVTLGPVIGWFAHDFYIPADDIMSMMGLAVSVSWSGFWTVKTWASENTDD